MIYKLFKNPLLWIFLLALFLRLYKLAEFPVGLHVDEIKAGWNALSIIETGRDDHGGLLSLYYDSFGDYRPTGILYITIPSVLLFGRDEFAIRFPSALFGALSVIPIYLITNILTKKKKVVWNFEFGHFAAFLMAANLWHIETSRATSEVVISTFFALCSIYYLIIYIQAGKARSVIFSLGTLIISYLLYHSIRVLMPFFFLTVVFFYRQEIQKKITKKLVILALIFTFLLSLFLGIGKESRQRLSQVSVLKDVDIGYEIERLAKENIGRNYPTRVYDNKYFVYLKHIFFEYSRYFDANFLIGSGAKPYRYSTPGAGLLTYFELLVFAFGIVQIIRKKFSPLPLIFLFIAPIPAAITTEDAPNLHRAFLMLPMIMIIGAYGFGGILNFSKKYKNILFLATLFLLLLNFGFSMHMYFKHSFSHRPFIKNLAEDAPSYRNIGAKEVALRIDDLSQKYEKIVITNFPDSPLYWYAYLTMKDPNVINRLNELYAGRSSVYKNIVFSSDKCVTDNEFMNQKGENILFIESGVCAYQSKIDNGDINAKIIERIYGPDGSEIYALLERN